MGCLPKCRRNSTKNVNEFYNHLFTPLPMHWKLSEPAVGCWALRRGPWAAPGVRMWCSFWKAENVFDLQYIVSTCHPSHPCIFTPISKCSLGEKHKENLPVAKVGSNPPLWSKHPVSPAKPRTPRWGRAHRWPWVSVSGLCDLALHLTRGSWVCDGEMKKAVRYLPSLTECVRSGWTRGLLYPARVFSTRSHPLGQTLSNGTV